MDSFNVKSMNLMDHYDKVPMALTIKPGMAWAIWTDKGPSGPCGQSMNTTMPHGGIMFFGNIDTLNAYFREHKGRKGVQTNLLWGEVGDWGTGNVTLSMITAGIENV